MVRFIDTLGKYDERRPWKLICIVNPFDLLLKNSQKSNLSLDDKNLKWEGGGGIIMKVCFSLIHIGHINGNLLFNAF